MNTTAKDIMSSRLIVAREGMNIEDALKLLVNNKITGLPVVDDSGMIIGILSEYDIIAHVGKESHITSEIFRENATYSKNVESVTEETSFTEILERFIKLKCRRLPVLDASKRLVGIISRRDVMKVLYYRAKVN
ncbi:MAG: HPP family protein [Bacteriovoracia bacterium]